MLEYVRGVNYCVAFLLFLLCCSESDKTRRDRFFLLGIKGIDTGDYLQAVGYFNKALEVDADFALTYNNRGIAQYNLNKV